jgi:hypothetical protein
MLARTRVKTFMATVFASSLLAVTAAAPASSQPVIIVPGGLVNIVIIDAVDLEEVNVQVPIGVAVNVCGVSVLSQDFSQTVDCTAETTQDLPVAFRP